MGFGISVCLSVLVLLIYILSRPEISIIRGMEFLEVIEAKTLDWRFRWRGTRHPGDEIVIVAIDEKTEDELGRWQSSGRQWLSHGIDLLTEAGARLIGLDMILSEPGDRDDDRQFAHAMERSGRVIVGVYHYFDRTSIAHLSPEIPKARHEVMIRTRYAMIRYPTNVTPHALNVGHAVGVEAPLQLFADVARSFGHTNIMMHDDGFIRHVPLLIEYMGNYYPAFSVEVARTVLNPPTPPVIWSLGGGRVDTIQIADIHIPVDESGRLLINYYGGQSTFSHYSLVDLLHETIPLATFQDKIVLIGLTSPLDHDMHSTSFHTGTHPGVEIQATILANILQQDFLSQSGALVVIDSVLLVVLGVIMGILLPRMSLFTSVLIVLCSLFALGGIGYFAFVYQKIWLNMTFPTMFILLDSVMLMLHTLYRVQHKTE